MVEEYKGFKIVPRFEGIPMVPDRPMGIASFVVSSDDVVCVFAFGVGLLSRMADENLTEEYLLDNAKSKIRGYIDSGRVKNLEEFTFELQNQEFVEVKDARWWNKTLKELYG